MQENTYSLKCHATDCVLDHKTSTDLKELKSYRVVFIDHNGIKLETNNRDKKNLQTMKINTLLSNGSKRNSQEKLLKIHKLNEDENKIQHTKICGRQLKQCQQGNL